MEAKGSGYHTMQQVVDNIIKYKNFTKQKILIMSKCKISVRCFSLKSKGGFHDILTD